MVIVYFICYLSCFWMDWTQGPAYARQHSTSKLYNPVLQFGIYKTLYLMMLLCAKDMNSGVWQKAQCDWGHLPELTVRELLSCSDLSARLGGEARDPQSHCWVLPRAVLWCAQQWVGIAGTEHSGVETCEASASAAPSPWPPCSARPFLWGDCCHHGRYLSIADKALALSVRLALNLLCVTVSPEAQGCPCLSLQVVRWRKPPVAMLTSVSVLVPLNYYDIKSHLYI